MAHELVHCFTGYLLKEKTMHTPAPVSYGYNRNTSLGESGRKWEHRMFGGYIDARERGEMVYLGANKETGDRVYIADEEVIKAILNKGKTFTHSRNTHTQ